MSKGSGATRGNSVKQSNSNNAAGKHFQNALLKELPNATEKEQLDLKNAMKSDTNMLNYIIKVNTEFNNDAVALSRAFGVDAETPFRQIRGTADKILQNFNLIEKTIRNQAKVVAFNKASSNFYSDKIADNRKIKKIYETLNQTLKSTIKTSEPLDPNTSELLLKIRNTIGNLARTGSLRGDSKNLDIQTPIKFKNLENKIIHIGWNDISKHNISEFPYELLREFYGK